MSDSLTGGKFRSLFKAVFLPYSRMKAHFPLLEKWPALLPWYWLIRIFQNLKGNLKKKRKMLDYRGLKEEDFAEMKEFFKAGGIKQ